ncbi:hypothetical protein [Tangfeifania diversioriginum]|uniref:hypothetical protein n=1 Tax=Tangfeifania diversioriginum TaxID=1168035 RepID=UPI000934ADD1|nr:hypothetical protein [Tangfeifania diversioriginum]
MTILAEDGKDNLPQVTIPRADEWSREQVVLEAGPKGSWDARLYGQISPCTVVKKNGTWLLYYIGANGNRTTDGGPANRSLGVATSTDGIHFKKFEKNPILTHQPQNNPEEGVFSAGAILDNNSDILLYFGATLASNPTTESVQCNAGLASSNDGFHFENQGYVFSWNDSQVWGHGDEISPIGAFRAGEIFNVYYIAKSAEVSWGLGVARGDSPSDFSRFIKVQDEQRDIIGGCDPIRISNDSIALFVVKDFSANTIEVLTAHVDHPEKLTGPVRKYSVFRPNYRHTTVYLDRERKMWFMYQSTDQPENGNKIVVRTAPMKLVDSKK